MIESIKRIIVVTLALALLVSTVSLAGCSQKDNSADTITVKDCSGVEVTIKKDIKTVIAPNQPFCEFLIAMGLGEKLKGSHGSVIGHSWAPYFMEDILSVEMYGYKPEAEALYAANADLVVVKNSAYAQALRDQGVPAIYFGYGNLEELYYAVDLMGQIFGAEAQSFVAKWQDRMDKTLSTLKQEVGSIDESEKKNIYFINAAVNPGSLYTTYGGESFTEYWINSIGANLVTSPFKDIEEIDQEVAISLNPDTIFISGYAQYTRLDELTQDPLWSDIDAVKNNQIFVMPTAMMSFDRFAVELPLLLEYSANLIYPEKHSFNAQEDFNAFFNDFYGKTFSENEITQMIKGLNPDGSRMD